VIGLLNSRHISSLFAWNNARWELKIHVSYSSWFHVNKTILVWVCTTFMKPGHHCSLASEHVVQHPWELLNFSLMGCMTLVWHSFWYKFITVPSRFSVPVYVITSGVRVHPSSGTRWNSHSGVETHTRQSVLWKHSITARINPTSPWKVDFITCKCKCKCCGSILSLVRFLFSFVNVNRIAQFPLAKNADLVTQSFMCSHDNVKK